jgi:hypothetical protein
MNFYKIVSLPIEVSDSDYCWDGKTICKLYVPILIMKVDMVGVILILVY